MTTTLSKLEQQPTMADPDSWPLEPILPLVRPQADGGFPQLGFLVATDGTVPPIVFLGEWEETIATIAECPCLRYGSLDEVAKAGWEID